jgi:Transglutaminase-like superfamily
MKYFYSEVSFLSKYSSGTDNNESRMTPLARFRQITTTLIASFIIVTGVQNARGDTDISPQAREACLVKIKSKLKSGDLSFELSHDAKVDFDAATINNFIKQTTASLQAKYTVNKNPTNGLVNSLDVSQEQKNKSFSFQIKRGVSTPNDGSDYLFDVYLTYNQSKSNPVSRIFLTENWIVDNDCNLSFNSVTRNQYHLYDRTLRAQEIIYNGDGRAGAEQVEEGEAKLTDGQTFDESSFEADAAKTPSRFYTNMTKIYARLHNAIFNPSKDIVYSGIPSHPFLWNNQRILKNENHFDPLLKKNTSFDMVETDTYLDSTIVSSFISGTSTESHFSYTIANNMNYQMWSVDENYWDNSTLNGSAETVERTATNTSATPEEKNTILDLYTNEELKYENLSAYYSLISKQTVAPNAEGWKFKYRLAYHDYDYHDLMERYNAREIEHQPLKAEESSTLSSPPTDVHDLDETKFVQIHIPEVEKWIQWLKQTYPDDISRLDMADYIVDLINYKLLTHYDETASQKSEVYQLNTSDILKRGTGVCQHYATLFASLARGLGIPTRIVFGFNMKGDSISAHAWNEIEIRPGVWRPIEPENYSAEFTSEWYVPLLDGRWFEEDPKKISAADYVRAYDFGDKFAMRAKFISTQAGVGASP